MSDTTTNQPLRGLILQGSVHNRDGTPASGLTVRAFDRNAGVGDAPLGAAAGLAAAGSVMLAAEAAKAAALEEGSPIRIADEYYGSHLSDVSKLPAQVMQLMKGFFY